MDKNANEIDQFHDPSFRVLAQRLLEVPEIEPYIKTASLDSDELASLPDSAFAWEERRLFPIHTAEQTALSYLYATRKEASAPREVIETLQDTLQAYGVALDISMQKEAAAPVEDLNDYLVPDQRRWRVTDEETVKTASYALSAYGQELSFEDQVRAASRLVKKAAAYGVRDLDVHVLATAGATVSDLDTTRDWLEVRASLAPEQHQAAYTKIASELQGVHPISHDRQALVKLASTIYELDKVAGLDRLYRSKIPNAMETVFNTHKLAEEMVELAGTMVPVSKLASLPSSFYADVFGDDILPEITSGTNVDGSKLATVLPTMPRDLNLIFLKQAKAYLR